MSSSRLLYGTTVFLGAFLLFLVEPMAAKQLLPVLGGSSAVWLTCLVFFQVTLLLGYLYAHWITRCHASALATACLSRDPRRSSCCARGAENLPRHLDPKPRSSGRYHLLDPRLHHRPALSSPRRNQPSAAAMVFALSGREHPLPALCSFQCRLFPCPACLPVCCRTEPHAQISANALVTRLPRLRRPLRHRRSTNALGHRQQSRRSKNQPPHEHQRPHDGSGSSFPWPPPCS